MIRIAAALVAMTLTTAALAEPLADGRDAAMRGDYAEALRLWLPLAQSGNAAAEHNIGLLYARGAGVEQDFAEAFEWFSRAAFKGSVPAQYNLAQMHRRGDGALAQDYQEALTWYRLAAAAGHPGAQLNIGMMYAEGWGVTADPVTAYAWFSLAYAYGDQRARGNMDAISRDLTFEQIAEARRLATDLQPTAIR